MMQASGMQSPDGLSLDAGGYQQQLYLQQEHPMQSMNVRSVQVSLCFRVFVRISQASAIEGSEGGIGEARASRGNSKNENISIVPQFLSIPLPTAQTELEQATMIGEYARAAGVTKQD